MNDCTYNSQFLETNENATTTATNTQNNTNEITTNEQEEEETEDTRLWSIDDDTLFYPLGLINHGTGAGKSVFVTWSEDYLLNFVFKTSKKTRRTQLTKVRLTTGEQEQISEILILKFNTLLLMQSGRVHYFTSVKSVHAIEWLNGVRCISTAQVGFSIIRLLPDNSLSLEVYRDVMNIGKSEPTLVQRFDVTYDERNLFNCQWRDERFTLMSHAVSAENVSFLEQVTHKTCDLSGKQEVHFFSVSGSLFALIADTNEGETANELCDCHIQLLNTYTSNVEFIKINCERELCVVFLQCGTIDIWYMSSIARSLQRITHHTGTQFTHYDFCSSSNCFYYTDTEKVAQLQFQYDAATDVCLVTETFKAITGMLACTWVDSIQKLVCLSWNNIFYQLDFSTVELTEASEYESLNTLYELTPRKISRLLEQVHGLNELAKLPQQLHQQIEREYMKQQLIAVASKEHIYRNNFHAKLEFNTQIPTHFQRETVLLYTRSCLLLQANSLFALIHLKIYKNDIFQAAHWNLHIDFECSANVLAVPSAVLHKNLCVVVPLEWQPQRLLPQFKLNMIAHVASGSDFLLITLPIELQIDASTYSSLFSTTKLGLSMCAEHRLSTLVAQFNKQKPVEQASRISYTIALPKSCKFSTILSIFNAGGSASKEHNSLDIHFLTCTLRIDFMKQQKSVRLECADAAALYYMRLFLRYHFQQLPSGSGPSMDCDDHVALQQLVMQYQCDIERCYGTLMECDDNHIFSVPMHLENLKRIYTKMRTEFGKLFS